MWQTASDLFIFLGWLWQNFVLIGTKIFAPVQYVYTFLKSFVAQAFGEPVANASMWSFSTDIKSIFNTIPYFSNFLSAILIGIAILFAVFILRQFLKS